MALQKIDIIQEYPKGFSATIQLCLQLCRYHFEEETQFGYRFVWKQEGDTIPTEKTGIPSVSAMLQLSAMAIQEGWGQFSAENRAEIEQYSLTVQIAAKEKAAFDAEDDLTMRFSVGSFIQRGNAYFKVLSNENDFVGRALNQKGELVDPFYFDYHTESSQEITDPVLLAELKKQMISIRPEQILTREWMEDAGFQLNSYPNGRCYELDITDFDRATEIAELAGVKFDKLSGVHHVILQCDEAFESCFFFCDNDYWEMAIDVFVELIKKLTM